jgi:hypothetical protein
MGFAQFNFSAFPHALIGITSDLRPRHDVIASESWPSRTSSGCCAGAMETLWRHACVDSGRRELPPASETFNKAGLDRLVWSSVVLLVRAHNPKVGVQILPAMTTQQGR